MLEGDKNTRVIGWAALVLALASTVNGCGTEVPDGGVRLMARGTLVSADGTPLADVHIEIYEISFYVSTLVGEAEITRTIEGDEWGRPIVTDATGQFAISEGDAAVALPTTECDEDDQPKQLWLQGDRFVDAAPR